MPAAQDSPPRVLCVDDNRDVADSTADLLRAVGFDARACYDGPTALAAAAETCPGVCLIDLNMPGMAGDELAVRLRAAIPADRPVLVALTARGDAASRGRTESAGFDLHLVKPVDPTHLVALINALCRLRAAAVPG